jgi:hypothetical protein
MFASEAASISKYVADMYLENNQPGYLDSICQYMPAIVADNLPEFTFWNTMQYSFWGHNMYHRAKPGVSALAKFKEHGTKTGCFETLKAAKNLSKVCINKAIMDQSGLDSYYGIFILATALPLIAGYSYAVDKAYDKLAKQYDYTPIDSAEASEDKEQQSESKPLLIQYTDVSTTKPAAKPTTLSDSEDEDSITDVIKNRQNRMRMLGNRQAKTTLLKL